MYKYIIGLGNPESYKHSRHNIGKQFLDYLSTTWSASSEGYISSHSGKILFKPSGYMNLCGRPIKSFLSKQNINLENILIIHDDIELQLGQIKLRKEGSALGHNGLKSIISTLQDHKFHRIRIGIGRPSSGEISDYVLSAFTKNERENLLETVFPQCIKLLSN